MQFSAGLPGAATTAPARAPPVRFSCPCQNIALSSLPGLAADADGACPAHLAQWPLLRDHAAAFRSLSASSSNPYYRVASATVPPGSLVTLAGLSSLTVQYENLVSCDEAYLSAPALADFAPVSGSAAAASAVRWLLLRCLLCQTSVSALCLGHAHSHTATAGGAAAGVSGVAAAVVSPYLLTGFSAAPTQEARVITLGTHGAHGAHGTHAAAGAAGSRTNGGEAGGAVSVTVPLRLPTAMFPASPSHGYNNNNNNNNNNHNGVGGDHNTADDASAVASRWAAACVTAHSTMTKQAIAEYTEVRALFFNCGDTSDCNKDENHNHTLIRLQTLV